jgi:hypothetical protein
MNVTYVCPQCEQSTRAEGTAAGLELRCAACGHTLPLPAEALSPDGELHACVVCGCRELFVRKDFPQRLGVAIVVCGFLASSIALAFHLRYVSYAILFATALIDLVLYLTVKNMLQCYRCQAVYRGLGGLEAFEPFNLETHERFRQQAIRMAQQKK